MNYIELNGVKSTTVNGLLIQSLPPISKPMMRTSVEEIDGRDGDIVTNLGYSAYDKEFTIGLYGDYDVDDAIKFFNSSGEVIFSNERDKYYRYQIIEQIDFDRLIRFRTAKVKLHVQPFKYDSVNRVWNIPDNSLNFATIRNRGNIYSRPKITIYGSGTAEIKINNVTVIQAVIDNGYITIDSEEMNAYHDGTLKNRQVIGDYSKIIFSVGPNDISWSDNVTAIEIENFSRWL